MEKIYKGMIVEESLKDNRILNLLEIAKVSITDDELPEDRWHIYNVNVSLEDINLLSNYIMPNWYMHFWKDNDIIAVFENKQFSFVYNDKSTWNEVTEYGISVGIPMEQLDFLIE